LYWKDKEQRFQKAAEWITHATSGTMSAVESPCRIGKVRLLSKSNCQLRVWCMQLKEDVARVALWRPRTLFVIAHGNDNGSLSESRGGGIKAHEFALTILTKAPTVTEVIFLWCASF
jgi:hypothetical protein